MSQNSKHTLLAEILQLYLKHGPAAFRLLSNQLRDPEFTREVASLIDSLLTALPEDKFPVAASRKRKQESLMEMVSEIAQGNSQRETLLKRIATALTDKRQLKTLRDIDRFSQDNGISLPPANKRKIAAINMLHAAASLSLDRLAHIADAIERRIDHDDSSLQGWSDIILRKSPPART